MILSWLLTAWAADSLVPSLHLRRHPNLGKAQCPELALTFDDGPDPRYTPRVLDILERYNVRASFFVVGIRAQRYPDLLRAIVEQGHDLGNHSYRHLPPGLQPGFLAYRDHLRTNRIIRDATGEMPVFARAPWGIPTAGRWWAALRSHQTYVHWTAHAYDWRPGISPDEIHERVVRQASPGGIVLLHDGMGYPGNPDAMIEALPGIIAELQTTYHLVPLRQWLPVSERKEVGLGDVGAAHLGPV